MKFITDLHLHSKYSRAVSQQMVLPQMAHWAKLKGLQVIATGDFTHPFWFDQIKNELEEAGNGLCRLKSASDRSNVTQEVYFLLSCEISSIYSQGGKVRRIHNLFFFPSLTSVEKFNKELVKRGVNVRSDGRPITGITSRNLAEIALKVDEKALVIPAHAWTPWFSVFGAFSGFDSLSECFGDMTDYVFAIETGLSSDPAMNWRIGDLEGKTILSFSDAHSLEKMGREATAFEADEISYDSIYQAIVRKSENSENSQNQKIRKSDKSEDLTNRKSESSEYSGNSKIAFTIEFYPEEGKYHYTGHRDCNYSQGIQKSKEGTKCPVCGRSLTIGVVDRVEDLASGISNFKFQISNGVRWIHSSNSFRPPYVSLVPLSEIIAQALGVATGTKKVTDAYLSLVNGLGSEFNVLLKADLADITKFAPQRVTEGIEKVRTGKITVDPGYDGKFGVVKIWSESLIEEEKKEEESQLNLFV